MQLQSWQELNKTEEITPVPGPLRWLQNTNQICLSDMNRGGLWDHPAPRDTVRNRKSSLSFWLSDRHTFILFTCTFYIPNMRLFKPTCVLKDIAPVFFGDIVCLLSLEIIAPCKHEYQHDFTYRSALAAWVSGVFVDGHLSQPRAICVHLRQLFRMSDTCLQGILTSWEEGTEKMPQGEIMHAVALNSWQENYKTKILLHFSAGFLIYSIIKSDYCVHVNDLYEYIFLFLQFSHHISLSDKIK